MICPKCNGSGWDDEHMIKCTNCDNGVVEQTNEEWFCQLTTEEKADFLDSISFCDFCYCSAGEICELNDKKCIYADKDNKECWLMWLKQPHRNE